MVANSPVGHTDGGMGRVTFGFGAFRALAVRTAALLAPLAISACGMNDVPRGLPAMQPTVMQAPKTAEGEVVGNGDTRVALLLPLSAEGNGARVATELRNAALLALQDAEGDPLQLVIKDTAGTEAGASAAAAAAAREGAALVLGPLFAANVRAAASALPGSRTPIMAFSSDSTVAGPNVYLNAYPPEGLVERIVAYSVSQGLSNIVAIVPAGPAGDLAEMQARKTLRRTGGELVALARYDYSNASVQAAVQEVAVAVGEADAVFLPDGGNSPAAIAGALKGMGFDLAGKRLLGTGQWASVDLSDPVLSGAWFADTDRARMDAYRDRYQQRYGTEPSVTSALAYDSVILAAMLARKGGAAAFSQSNLQMPSGFAGYTGTFRFRPDGTVQRSYAVYEIVEGDLRLVSPASSGFGGF